MTVLPFFLAFIAFATFSTLRDWRKGVLFAIVIGALQDPVRKATPGTPALLVLSSLPVWAVMAYRAVLDQRAWHSFRAAYPLIANSMRFFILCLPLPALLVLEYGLGAWKLAVLGLFNYLAPIAGILIGYSYALQTRDVQRVLAFYCLVIPVSLLGGPIEYLGLAGSSPIIGTGALGFTWIRFGVDSPFRLISGLYRSPDVMGWHAGALIMLGSTLILHARRRRSTLLTAVALGAVCVLLSGRRKMLMMPIVWAAFFIATSVRAMRVSRVVVMAGLALVTLAAVYYAAGEIGISEDYYAYALSATQEGRSRVVSSAWDQVWETVRQSGLLGAGIGVATQGAQHLGRPDVLGWQESGPSRLMVELGLPGFLGAFFLAYALARTYVRRLAQASSAPNLSLGLVAFAAANAASFTVSHQVYGDLFISSLTSFLVGAGLSSLRQEAPATRYNVQTKMLADAWRPSPVAR